MTIAMFVIGVLVFLVTVYGTLMVGGVMLTGRQLDDQPELDVRRSEDSESDTPTRRRRARRLLSTDY